MTSPIKKHTVEKTHYVEKGTIGYVNCFLMYSLFFLGLDTVVSRFLILPKFVFLFVVVRQIPDNNRF